MTFEITLDEETRAALSALLDDDKAATLVIEEPWTERKFEPGDRVRVEFDNGPGPAEVVQHVASKFGDYVAVKYGPGGRYSTSLSPCSVETDNVVRHPGRVVRVEEVQ